MVWIGYAQDDVTKSVRPLHSSGFEQGYLETLKLYVERIPNEGRADRHGHPEQER